MHLSDILDFILGDVLHVAIFRHPLNIVRLFKDNLIPIGKAQTSRQTIETNLPCEKSPRILFSPS
jgi:hypothetical protein